MSLATALAGLAAEGPEQPCIIEARSGLVWTRSELLGQARAMAVGLRSAGLEPGDRLLVEVAHSARTLGWLLAGWLCDAVVVPIGPDNSQRERDFYTQHAGARLVVSAAHGVPTPAGVATGAPAPRLPQDGATAAILYTSGSTGDPKGVELSHRALLENARRVGQRYGLGPSTRFLSLLPLFHGHGLVVTCLAPLMAGGVVVLDGPFDAFAASRFRATVQRHGVTVFSAVPAILRLLVALCEPPSAGDSTLSLRFGLCASAVLAPSLQQAFEDGFGCPVGNSYGLTETAAWCSYGDPEPELRRPGAVGRPLPGTLRIQGPQGEVGEIQVRGPCVMSGYFRNPRATQQTFEDGWLRTGDLGRLDDDGHLFLVGRRRDVINHGGFSVYPGEVDQVLEAHPAVLEAATVERPSESHGEVPVSFVVLGSPVDRTALRAHCRDGLAPYKVPVEIIVLDALPRSATRKVRRDDLRAQLTEGRGE